MNRYEMAERAISRLFEDTSVPPSETANDLRALSDHIDQLLETLDEE